MIWPFVPVFRFWVAAPVADIPARLAAKVFDTAHPVLLRCGSIETAVGVMDRLIGLFEQYTELLCPLLAILLPGPLQFAEMVGVAQGVQPTVVEIGFPVIVTENPCKTWKDADRLHGLATPFGMGGEMAQPWAGNIM